MSDHFSMVKEYLTELEYQIVEENETDGLIVVANESNGIANLVLVLADPLLIVEQFIVELNNPQPAIYQELLKKSRDFVHGAFVLDETGNKLIFRNTHELENLDLNELEATFNSLALLLGEYAGEIIKLSKN